ncbi:hypothetical protein N878_08625 [Pseudomonas sp. EGD-AK9]|uniref:hypothetical protein n=1 Tax=Pseudomonas sp. EGD-AK9 TaxID=1386078 RepID=UPI000397B394|nr:hypothetical protein [Pseudomonas sp. EGD-AK9]ERI50512.1 hypothetical protein N878_08625 [Pseudomonas sp. EGD-AK9]
MHPSNETPKWLSLFITAFGTQGLIALAWWAGAFHAQRIRELQATYPILQITGSAGVGKSTLVANLWKLAGSEGENRNADSCSMGALLAFLVRAINRPVVVEESYRGDEYFDWNVLRQCYDGAVLPVRVSGTDETVNTFTFQGALAFVGGETEVLNRRIVNIHLVRQPRTDGHRSAVDALHDLQITEMAQFVDAVRMNREQVVYRLGHVAAYTESLQEEHEQRLPTDTARNHAQLRALLDLLADLFPIPADALHQAHCEVCDMAWQHVPGKTDFAVFKVEPSSTN